MHSGGNASSVSLSEAKIWMEQTPKGRRKSRCGDAAPASGDPSAAVPVISAAAAAVGCSIGTEWLMSSDSRVGQMGDGGTNER